MWDAAVHGAGSWNGVRRAPAGPAQTAPAEAGAGAGQGLDAAQAAPAAPAQDVWAPEAREEEGSSLLELIRDAQERAREHREQLGRLRAPVNYGEIPVEACARLARARSRRDVGAAEGYARRQISRLKAALRQDPDQSDAIRAALAQLEKAVCRAGRKKRQLDQEQLIQLQGRRAEQQRREREELRLRQELKRRRTSRSIHEQGYVHEAVIDRQMRAAMAAEAARWQLNAPQAPPAQGAAAYAAAAVPAAEAPPPAGGGVEVQA